MSKIDEDIVPERPRDCLREPLPMHFWAAFKLEEAVSAHNNGDRFRAAACFASTNRPEFREFLASLWGRYSKYNSPVDGVRIKHGQSALKGDRAQSRMPTKAVQREVIRRDGHICRYCGVPVVSPVIRKAINAAYPEAVPWGRKESDQHSGFQALWLQFDHVVPHSMQGSNEPANLVISCAGCNFGKSNYSLEQLGLNDPRDRKPILSKWIGLSDFDMEAVS